MQSLEKSIPVTTLLKEVAAKYSRVGGAYLYQLEQAWRFFAEFTLLVSFDGAPVSLRDNENRGGSQDYQPATQPTDAQLHAAAEGLLNVIITSQIDLLELIARSEN
jgi:hypothetical protein